MKTKVDLQEVFSYFTWPFWCMMALFLLLALGVAGFLFYRYYKKRKPSEKKPKVSEVKQFTPEDMAKIKEKYIAQIREIGKYYELGTYSKKESYQKLSLTIRSFIEEVTGVDVTTLTLIEMKDLQIPHLTRLISGYYEPEFSKKFDESKWDVKKSLDQAVEVVNRWN